MDELDESKLDNTLDLITKLLESSNERINLISSIQQLPEEKVLKKYGLKEENKKIFHCKIFSHYNLEQRLRQIFLIIYYE